MSDDMELSEKQLLRTGSLCSPDPHSQLLISFNDRDFDTFQKVLTTGIKNSYIDPNYFYDDPENGTLLDLACQKPGNYKYIQILLNCGADPNKINRVHKKSPLHFTVEFGDISYIKLLIADVRTNINVLDRTGSPPLHYSAKSNNIDAMMLLLNHPKINVNQANRKGQTAIHIAVLSDAKEAVLCLLQKINVDIDSFKTAQGKSGRDLILEKYPELEDKLPKISDNTVMENGSDKLVNKLFHLLHQRDIDNFIRSIQMNTECVNSNDGLHTFLQYGCEFGLYKIVEVLLRLGANPNATHVNNKKTPIMIASYKGYVNIIRLLIHNDSTDFTPIDGETVLHYVIKGFGDKISQTTLGSSKQEYCDHYESLELLLKDVSNNKLNINSGDIKGNTALHYAAKMGDKNFILLLLQYGAYVGQRNILNEPALADVNPKIFETYLDNCLTTNDLLPREDNYEIIFRYNFLAPPKKNILNNSKLTNSLTTLNIEHNIKDTEPEDEIISETDPLLYMSRSSDLRPLLKHPVLTSFLHLKWHKIRCFFYCNLIFYVIFWLLLTLYILMAYLAIKSDTTNNNEDDGKLNGNSTNNMDNDMSMNINSTILRISVGIFLIILIIRELFQLTISPLRYLANPENWLEVGLIGITVSILFCESCVNLRHQISAIAILLSWAELVLLIGRHPALSTNIEMLKTVSWNFLKFLAWYSILIIAFALSFYTLFCDSESTDDEENYFVDPAMSVFKTVVMLTGEFDAGSIPFVAHPGTSHILFVLFVFLIAIVLFNLLNGLAVSDTQSIKADAELVGYVSRVKLVSYVETMAMGDPVPYHGFLNKIRRLFCCIPNINCCAINYGCLKLFSRKINLFPDLYPDCEIRILPNQESRIEMCHRGHRRKRQDVESDDNICYNMCYNKTMDPEIVRAAKLVLAKKEDERITFDVSKMFQNYKEQLEYYRKALDDVINKSSNKSNDLKIIDYTDGSKDKIIQDLSDRLDYFNGTLNNLVKNSQRTEEQLNQILKLFQQKKPILSTSSSEEDNQ
ncbi:transient receptor potential cation channel subfamily A member 1-like [Lycorma delicatula]|uniref:transient receptor potential cation channel subfamily A member 1-like n=1 Tax=Lycorma delicatula TaxID=130591 RepID=UPI003F5131DC